MMLNSHRDDQINHTKLTKMVKLPSMIYIPSATARSNADAVPVGPLLMDEVVSHDYNNSNNNNSNGLKDVSNLLSNPPFVIAEPHQRESKEEDHPEDQIYPFEISSSKLIEFQLSPSRHECKTQITLTNPNIKQNHLMVFKIMCNNSNGYLVKPNKGVIRPGTSVNISCSIVRKYQEKLLYKPPNEFNTMNKDKILIKSCVIEKNIVFVPKYLIDEETSDPSMDISKSLSVLWNYIDSYRSSTVTSKKVRIKLSRKNTNT